MAGESDALKVELEAIKKLLVLGLLKKGTTQKEIARALDVSQSSISRMIPGKVETWSD